MAFDRGNPKRWPAVIRTALNCRHGDPEGQRGVFWSPWAPSLNILDNFFYVVPLVVPFEEAQGDQEDQQDHRPTLIPFTHLHATVVQPEATKATFREWSPSPSPPQHLALFLRA